MITLRRFRANDGYARWERWTAWPLVFLALVFVVVLILPLASALTETERRSLAVANIVIWAIFVVDYLARLYLAETRRNFVRTHVLDLIVIAVPFLRPFRVLRLFSIVASTSRRAGTLAVERITIYVCAMATIVMTVCAVVVYDAERDATGANITSLADSFWWAVTTVMTVGYGDRYPVTATGREVATVLMLTGIALIGTVTAAVAAYFVNMVRRASTADSDESASSQRDLLSDQIATLTTAVCDLQRGVTEILESLEGSTGQSRRSASD